MSSHRNLSIGDILRILQPTLPSPNTCDLIDINPGKAIWSQELHKVLQPNRHVLVEPRFDHYQDSLQPLLDSPASPYRCVSSLEDALDSANGLLSTYPEQHLTNSFTPDLTLNKSLLVTVNLSSFRGHATSFLGSSAKKFLNHLVETHLYTSIPLYRYGYVRILAWAPSPDKHSILPRTVAARNKQSVMLEASMNIKLLSDTHLDARHDRTRKLPHHALEREDFDRIAVKAGQNYICIPPSRRPRPIEPHLLTVSPTPASIRKAVFTSNAKWVPPFLALDDYLKQNDQEFYSALSSPKPTPLDYGSPSQDLRQKRTAWRQYLVLAKTAHSARMKASALVEEQRSLEKPLRSLTLAPDATVPSSVQDQWWNLSQQVLECDGTNRAWAQKVLDDYRAYDLDPPVLGWHHRDQHPVISNNDEFLLPAHPLVLFDMVPKADFASTLDSFDKRLCFSHVMTTASPLMARSVFLFLSRLVPGGVEEFLRTVPEIYQPSKGGWFDLEELRTRSLPAEMFVTIALAYCDWPFRLSNESIMLKTEGRDRLFVQR